LLINGKCCKRWRIEKDQGRGEDVLLLPIVKALEEKERKKISELLIKLLLPEPTRIGKPLLLANLPTMSAVVLSFTVSRAKRRY
jgi:hypothetical protein